jgi:hypothetical protein
VQRFAVEQRRPSGPDGEQLVAQGVEHDADAALARHRHGPLRDAEQIVDGPVEWVDDPAQAGRSGDVVALLPQDRVVGAPGGDELADRALGLDVGLGDQIGRRRLRLDLAHAVLVVAQQDLGRSARRRHRHVEELVVAHSGGRRSAQGRACSIWAASDSRVASSSGRPTSWTASGRPAASKPAGTDAAGWPVTLKIP